MTSTTAAYLQISSDLPKWQSLTAAQPDVKLQTAYYKANIGAVKTPSDLVNNYRLFSYVLNAYGLGDQIYAKALFQKILRQGTGSANDLAYTLHDPRILALAKAFNFAANGASTTSSPVVQTDVVNNYVEQTLETNQGKSNPGVQLALYFQRNAPSITSAYDILANRTLLTVVQTALGISPLTSAQNIDTQAQLIASKIKVSDFKDPKKLQSFIQRFTVLYDLNNPSGASSAQTSAVPNALINTSSRGFNVDLLARMQGLKLGGF